MTEYKKNDKGIWLPTNPNKQQSNPSKIPNITKTISNFISHIPKITALFTVIGIFIGNLNIYNYLKHINFDFLFSDIIGNSSSAIAILLMYFLFILLIMFGFMSPFLLNLFINFKGYDKMVDIKFSRFYIVSSMLSIGHIIIFFISVKIDFEHYQFIASFFSFYFMFTTMDLIYNKKQNIFLTILPATFVITIPFFVYFTLILKPTFLTIGEKDVHWLFFVASSFLFLFNYLISYILIKNRVYSELFLYISLFLIIIYAFFLSLFQDYNISLHKPKFIEKPQNSSWYLIHNANVNSEKINGLSKTEIQNLKLEFKPQDKDVKDIENPNTLYGYMAWNLGNTKVFCPQSVNFFKTNNQNERNAMSQKCLVIDGKYLQLVSEYYLKQPTEQ